MGWLVGLRKCWRVVTSRCEAEGPNLVPEGFYGLGDGPLSPTLVASRGVARSKVAGHQVLSLPATRAFHEPDIKEPASQRLF